MFALFKLNNLMQGQLLKLLKVVKFPNIPVFLKPFYIYHFKNNNFYRQDKLATVLTQKF